jgi:hypothetical protein
MVLALAVRWKGTRTAGKLSAPSGEPADQTRCARAYVVGRRPNDSRVVMPWQPWPCKDAAVSPASHASSTSGR